MRYLRDAAGYPEPAARPSSSSELAPGPSRLRQGPVIRLRSSQRCSVPTPLLPVTCDDKMARACPRALPALRVLCTFVALVAVAIALVVFLSGTEPTIALGGANALFQQQQWSLPSSVVGRARPTEQDDQEPAELQEPPPLQEPPQLQEPLPSPAPFARWLPQLRPDGCSDEHKTCAGWAAVGECKRNAKFMSTTCRLSCGLCDDLGRVERTQVEVSVSPAMPMSVQPSPVPMAASSSAKGCYDIHPRCAEFVAAGECTRNAHYMHAKCAASCDACEEIAAMEAAARAARRMSSSSRRRS